jgi:putative flippase GtrA
MEILASIVIAFICLIVSSFVGQKVEIFNKKSATKLKPEALKTPFMQ